MVTLRRSSIFFIAGLLALLGQTARADCVAPNVMTTFAGASYQRGYIDGPAKSARFGSIIGAAVDGAGNLYVLDSATKFTNAVRRSSVIRKITPEGNVSTLAGDITAPEGNVDGQGGAARFMENAWSIAADAAGNVYVGDSMAVRKVTPQGVVTTIARTADWNASNAYGEILGITLDRAGAVFIMESVAYYGTAVRGGVIHKIEGGVASFVAGSAVENGSADGVGAAARFYQASSMAVDASGALFVSDSFNYTIRKVTPTGRGSIGAVSTFAGRAGVSGEDDGTTAYATFRHPRGLTLHPAGTLYAVDGSYLIRRIDTAQGQAEVHTLIRLSDDITGLSGIAYSRNAAGEDFLYVVDSSTSTVSKLSCPPVSSLIDGSFEVPNLGPGTFAYLPPASPWRFSGGAGIQVNGSAWQAAPAVDGAQTAFLQNAGAQISQTVTIAAEGVYGVSFHAARRLGQVQPIVVLVNGAPLGQPITPGSNSFTQYTTPGIRLAAGSHTVEFRSGGAGPDNTSFIDVVTVVKDPKGPPYGLTFTVSGSRALSCHGGQTPLDNPHAGSCNPYQGDTTCRTALPVACYRDRNIRFSLAQGPGIRVRELAATRPVAGSALRSAQDGSALCAEELGNGWRMAEFHDGGSGWTIDGIRRHSLTNGARLWVHINDQPGNCWGR